MPWNRKKSELVDVVKVANKKSGAIYVYYSSIDPERDKRTCFSDKEAAFLEIFGVDDRQAYVLNVSRRSMLSTAWSVLSNFFTFLGIVRRTPKGVGVVLVSRGPVGLLMALVVRLWSAGMLVREIHAYQLEEVLLMRQFWFSKLGGLMTCLISMTIDRLAHCEIVNHRALASNNSLVSFNGCDPDSSLSPSDARCYETCPEASVPAVETLVFTGSAAPWHGVRVLCRLQRAILDMGLSKSYQVVLVGGESPELRALGGAVISPADVSLCRRYIATARLLLLPCDRSARISPGNPLKLYEYLQTGIPIATHAGLSGYEDEVRRFGQLFPVSLDRPHDLLESLEDSEMASPKQAVTELFTWERRLYDWRNFLDGLDENAYRNGNK